MQFSRTDAEAVGEILAEAAERAISAALKASYPNTLICRRGGCRGRSTASGRDRDR
jgi:hypothetical protein